MRMRKKHNREQRLERVSKRLVSEPEKMHGHWRELFGNDNPLHIEIGCGKGRFIAESARQMPDINFIAFDVIPDVVLMGLEKTDAENLENLRFVIADASYLNEFFAPGELDRIYLNFSDPWKKKKQAKRRLTHAGFLDIYREILADGAAIWFKTDNRALFEFSLNSFCADRGFQLSNISLDLHNSGFEGNIMTEYEEKFSSQGMPIYRLEAKKL